MSAHVVYDLGGAGRVVGVFSNARRAARVVAVNPAYYRAMKCEIDQVSDEAFNWLKSLEQKERLEKLRALR